MVIRTTDELKWYMDTRKWRKSHRLDASMMDRYDDIWYDRLIGLSIIMIVLGVIAGTRIKFLFI